ncbi:granulocyte colony-stimulating factor isoform X4 [Cebus imitator]|uniref:granulocyte colony-stimulating factor isoform X4 n=1 Tax=Cebus imitator TaxID=2715852 RepID=UPI001897DF10|nr:granulocyte colony-stimulating factor isoform X4 [Cebus imitator]
MGLCIKAPLELGPKATQSLQPSPTQTHGRTCRPEPHEAALQLLLWHSALWMVQEAAPLGPASSLPQSFLLKCLEQVRKVQGDGTELQEKLTGCLRQLHSGLFLYQGLLQTLEGISPELAPTVDMLRLDIADFATTIWQQMEELGTVPALQPTRGAMPALPSAFQRRVGGLLVASHLQSFLELVHRVLRHLAQP